MELPRDPFILYSYLNTLLRDRGLDFSELCRDMELPEEEIRESLYGASGGGDQREPFTGRDLL